MKGMWLILLLSTVLLTGCTEEAKHTVAAQGIEASGEAVVPVSFSENPRITDDLLLTEVGASVSDSKGTLTLTAINTHPICQTIGPVELTVHETKLLHYRPNSSLLDFYQSYTSDTEFHVIKLAVEFTNTSERPVQFSPAETILTSGGEMRTWEDDVYQENLGGMIGAGETKKGTLGVIIEQAGFEVVTITTSDLFSAEGQLSDTSKIINIEF